jgi:uncharacterized cofD-like protein
MTHLTGDFAKAVQLSSEVLASCGKIYPCTSANVVLEATLANGRVVSGETTISKSRSRIHKISIKPRSCRPVPETLDAIRDADLITFGPGSLFTSVIPNLLVKGIPEAIANSKAIKAYFVNLMWQPGETTDFRASDHLAAIHQHAGRAILDYAIVNTRPIPAPLRRRYARQLALPVENDMDGLAEIGVKVLGAELATVSAKVRHDSAAIAAVAIRLAQEARKKRSR